LAPNLLSDGAAIGQNAPVRPVPQIVAGELEQRRMAVLRSRGLGLKRFGALRNEEAPGGRIMNRKILSRPRKDSSALAVEVHRADLVDGRQTLTLTKDLSSAYLCPTTARVLPFGDISTRLSKPSLETLNWPTNEPEAASST
jgi:hypothetical protein